MNNHKMTRIGNIIRAVVLGGLLLVVVSVAQGGLCTSPIYSTCGENDGLGFDVDGNGTEDYYVHNHLWNAAPYGATGCTDICSFNSWKHTANAIAADLAVKTYPNTHRNYNSLPLVSSFPVLTSTFGFSAPGNGIYNVAYDIWLNGFDLNAGGYEIMIWTENHNQRPGGNVVASGISISGYNWDLWQGGANGHLLSFAAPLDTTTGKPSNRIIGSGNFDIKAFLNYLSSTGRTGTSEKLRQLDFGVEIVSTDGVNRVFNLTDFSITDTGTAPPVPAAPSSLTATAVSSSQINLSWTDNSGNETGFKIERKTGAGGTYSQIATVGANVTTYSNTGLAASTTYFYRVRANNGSGDSAYSNEASATTQAGGTAPAAPAGLTATAVSSSQINLAWTASSGATSYNVKRATVSGGPYSTIATGVTTTSYSNTGLSASTTYYYVVSAVNSSGESANSSQASATTQASSSGPNLALNRPVAASGYEFDGSTAQTPEQAVDGNATTLWKSRNLDNEWIYVDLGGSKSINQVGLKWDWSYPSAYKIQISTQASNPTAWTDVYSTTTFTGGNVVNSFTAVNATFCRLLCVTRAVLFGQQWQNKLFEFEVYGPSGTPPSITTQPASQTVTVGQTATFSVVATGTAPLSYQWRKNGANISGATSSSYTTPATVSSDNGALFSVLVSNAYGSTTSANATLTVTSGGGSLPSPWQTSDIGAVAAAGSASFSNGTFTVAGSGEDIQGTADEFRYVYQVATGNCEIKARVAGVGNTNPWAKAGVMIRETLAAGSKHAYMNVTPSSGVEFLWRSSTGGSSSQSLNSGSAPLWVRVVRSNKNFTGYISSNGVDWTQVGSINITMSSSVYIGLGVTAHNDGQLNTSTFDNVTATP
jgi:hypothetical protein